MTLANRLTGDWAKRPFVIIERDDLAYPGEAVGSFLDSIGQFLYRPHCRSTGAILLSPGQITGGSGYEMMVLDHSIDAAEERGRQLVEHIAKVLAAKGTEVTSTEKLIWRE